MKTLIWKELRENARWLPVGLILVSLVVWMVAPRRFDSHVLITLGLLNYLSVLLPVLALALGVVQSFRDLQPAAGAYLQHRSVTTREVFLAKTAAGFCIYGLAVAVPLACMAIWIAMRGMDWVPMRPAQVVPPLVYGVMAFLMHPAAMLMMVRSASWWGTRWFPLLPVSAMLFLFAILLRTRTVIDSAGAALVAGAALAGLVTVAYTAWRELASDPPASHQPQSRLGRWAVNSYVTLSSMVAILGGLLLIVIMAETSQQPFAPHPYHRMAVDQETGEPWLLTYRQTRAANHGWESRAESGDRIQADKEVNPQKPLDASDAFQDLVVLGAITESHRDDGFFSAPQTHSGSSAGIRWVYDFRGYLLGYQGLPGLPRRWELTLAADGFYPAGELTGRAFSANPIAAGWRAFSDVTAPGFKSPLIDASGVYLLQEEPPAIRTIIDQPIEAAATIGGTKDRGPRLLLVGQGKLSEYRLLDAAGSEAWWIAPGLYKPHFDAYQLSAQLVQSVDLPPALASTSVLSVAPTADGFVVAPGNALAVYPPQQVYRLLRDGRHESMAYQITPGTLSRVNVDAVSPRWLGFVPVVVLLILLGAAAWIEGGRPPELAKAMEHAPSEFAALFVTGGIVLIISWLLVAVITRRRDLARSRRRLWYAGVPLLGLAAPLAILAIYQRVYWESCPRCDKPRRIDQDRCAHCGAAWEPPPSEGIEISDAPQYAAPANVTAPA